VGHDQRSPEECGLTVENTGERLTARLAATLAEPFQRGTKRIRTDHAGDGLGLTIVKRITYAHDGTLSLTPRAASGLRCVERTGVADDVAWTLVAIRSA
jgi:two-component system, OmpR family, sensor histidine kinase VanS